MFSIQFSSQSKRFLKKSEKSTRDRLIKKIEELSTDPFPSDTKRVVSQKKQKVFRIRTGDFRISYAVFDKQKEILVFEIEKRSRAY